MSPFLIVLIIMIAYKILFHGIMFIAETMFYNYQLKLRKSNPEKRHLEPLKKPSFFKF